MKTTREERTTVKSILFAAFFVTGACGLVYELVAMRLLRIVMGNDTYAVATVFSAFMCGLAVGGFAGGRAADGTRRPFRAFSLLVAGTAVYFCLLPYLLDLASPVYVGVYRLLSGLHAARQLWQFTFGFLLLAVPCVLMGATLPMLTRAFTASPDAAGAEAGRLYAFNTLGAVAGAFLAGFVLLPAQGVSSTLRLACALALLTAGIPFFFDRRGGRAVDPVSAARPAEADGRLPRGRRSTAFPNLTLAVLLGYGLSGFAALTYEVAWSRVLALLIGSSVYALSLILIVFIAGLGLGSLACAPLVRRIRHPLPWLALIEAGIGLSAVSVVPLLDRAVFLVARIGLQAGDSLARLLLAEGALVAAVMIVPAFLMGAAFPPAARLVACATGNVGGSVGRTYGWNTVGSAAGAFCAGFLLLPAFGLQGTILTAAVINLAVAALFIALSRPLSARLRMSAAAAAVLASAAMVLLMPPWKTEWMTFGPFIAARRLSAAELSSERALRAKAEEAAILYHKEGVSATVTVKETAAGERVIFVDGKPDASSRGDLHTELLAGHLPVLLHPEAGEVLIIGLASGITAGAVAAHPVGRIECVEIEPCMVEACRFFSADNRRVLDDPRLEVIIADGRNRLAVSDRTYDVIISEPSNPWIAGIADLFTLEFFGLCRNRLKPNGLVCVWIDAYTLDHTAVGAILRTFARVFPNVTLWHPGGSDYLAIGSLHAQALPLQALEAAMARPTVADDLDRIDIRDAADLLGHWVTDTRGVARLAAGAPLITDDRQVLEFSAPRSMLRNEAQWRIAERLADEHTTVVSILLAGKADEDHLQAVTGKTAALIAAREHVQRAAVFLARQDEGAACAELSRAVREGYRFRELNLLLGLLRSRAAATLKQGSRQGAEEQYRRILSIDPRDPEAHYGFAFVLEKKRDFEGATRHYARALDEAPGNNGYRLALAGVLHRAGRTREALLRYRSAAEAEPDRAAVRHNLALVLAEQAEQDPSLMDEALRQAERACELSRWKDPRMLQALARLQARIGRLAEARRVLEMAVNAARADGIPRLAALLEEQARRLQVRAAPDAANPPAPGDR